MSDDDDTFYGCVECSGDRGRPRRSGGSAICKFDGCKRSYAKKRKLDRHKLLTESKLEPVTTWA